ncbi:MAG: capsular biosynthesis protein [Pseudomonadota bacterium]
MIDLHSHLLPGIDDGPTNLEDALDLARYAVNNGITHSVLTPHIHLGRYNNNLSIIAKIFQQFKQALIKNNIDLKIAFSAEVRLCVEIIEMINKEEIPFLGEYQGKKLLLLEMPHSHIPPGSSNLINWLNKRNILVVIAHPERNKELHMNIQKAAELIKQGCLFQITSASVTGNFGSSCKLLSEKFLEYDWVHFIATDAHNLKHRPPDLKQCRDVLSEKFGAEYTKKLFYDNPWEAVAIKFA